MNQGLYAARMRAQAGDRAADAADQAPIFITVTGGGAGEVMTGTVEADSLNGRGGDDTITGAEDDDTLRGGAGDDSIHGGDDNDRVWGADGDDRIDAGTGEDTLFGGDGNDVMWSFTPLTSDDDDDFLWGGAGDDDLSTGGFEEGHSDRLWGGIGDDTLRSAGGENNLDGGRGNDTVIYDGAAEALFGFLAAQRVYRVSGNDNLSDDVDFIENIVGSDFADFFAGDRKANRIDGGDGDDSLSGRDGPDTLIGGDGVDLVFYDSRRLDYFGVDDDYPAGGVVVSLAAGVADHPDGGGRDTLIGIENVVGTQYADSLTGDDGANLLIGGYGADTFSGGLGDDTILGGGGANTVSFAGGPAVSVDLAAGTATGAGADVLSRIAHVLGSNLGDAIAGSGGANQLDGSGGDDLLDGRGGRDALIGGRGDDTLTGGAGADTLTGGVGSDVFVYQAVSDSPSGKGVDLITDLSVKDWIDLSAIDADTVADGDQAFVLASGFTGAAGEATVKFHEGSGLTTLKLDVDGDGEADMTVYFQGDHTGFSNFVL